MIILYMESLTGCGMTQLTPAPELTQEATGQFTSAPFTGDQWSIYHPDPQHLWNRIFRLFFRRTAGNGQEVGWDALDPLLWPDTTLETTTYQQAVALFDEFLNKHGEQLIVEPLKRALFQRDLWELFDWLGDQSAQHQDLQDRIARILPRLALTDEAIQSLPDNYLAAVDSGSFLPGFQQGDPNVGFLPAGLLAPDGEWVSVGRQGGPIAMTHTEEFPFAGRSVFLILLRVPGNRAAALSFLQALGGEPPPGLPIGLEVVLLRRAVLIDRQGHMVLSPIVESIQVRHFSTTQSFYLFELDRQLLFAGISGGLRLVQQEIPLFRSHGDAFSLGQVDEVKIPEICFSCHLGESGTEGLASLLSYSRARFPLPDNSRPILEVTTAEQEAEKVITGKSQEKSWQTLQTVWPSNNP
jgi:hypothetical protein